MPNLINLRMNLHIFLTMLVFTVYPQQIDTTINDIARYYFYLNRKNILEDIVIKENKYSVKCDVINLDLLQECKEDIMLCDQEIKGFSYTHKTPKKYFFNLSSRGTIMAGTIPIPLYCLLEHEYYTNKLAAANGSILIEDLFDISDYPDFSIPIWVHPISTPGTQDLSAKIVAFNNYRFYSGIKRNLEKTLINEKKYNFKYGVTNLTLLQNIKEKLMICDIKIERALKDFPILKNSTIPKKYIFVESNSSGVHFTVPLEEAFENQEYYFETYFKTMLIDSIVLNDMRYPWGCSMDSVYSSETAEYIPEASKENILFYSTVLYESPVYVAYIFDTENSTIEGNKLYKVKKYFLTDSIDCTKTYEKMKTYLIDRYGKPVETEERFIGAFYIAWKTPKTNITLGLIEDKISLEFEKN